MKGVYIGDKKMLISPVWGGKLIVSSLDRSIMPELTISGVYEPSLTNFLINEIKQGDIVFDIGANIGYFSILLGYLVGSSGQVHCYEPDSNNYALLKENISFNYLNNIINAKNKAVYSEDTVLSFYSTEKFKGNGSIHKHDEYYFGFFGNEKINEIQMEAECINQYIQDVPRIDLVKIDIEGGEYHALLGMMEYLKKRQINTIVFEFNKNLLREDSKSLHLLLEEISINYLYDFYLIDDKGNLVEASLDYIFSLDVIPSVVIKKSNEVDNSLQVINELANSCYQAVEYIERKLLQDELESSFIVLEDLANSLNEIGAFLYEKYNDSKAYASYIKLNDLFYDLINYYESADSGSALELIQSKLKSEFREWQFNLLEL